MVKRLKLDSESYKSIVPESTSNLPTQWNTPIKAFKVLNEFEVSTYFQTLPFCDQGHSYTKNNHISCPKNAGFYCTACTFDCGCKKSKHQESSGLQFLGKILALGHLENQGHQHGGPKLG